MTSWTDSGFPRQIEGEGAALAGRAFHPDIAALTGGDLTGQIQPDAKTLRLAGIRPAVKSAKDGGLPASGMPGPVSRTQTAVNIS